MSDTKRTIESLSWRINEALRAADVNGYTISVNGDKFQAKIGDRLIASGASLERLAANVAAFERKAKKADTIFQPYRALYRPNEWRQNEWFSGTVTGYAHGHNERDSYVPPLHRRKVVFRYDPDQAVDKAWANVDAGELYEYDEAFMKALSEANIEAKIAAAKLQRTCARLVATLKKCDPLHPSKECHSIQPEVEATK